MLLLLAAAGDRPSNGVDDGNLLSRFTKRATGVVVDAVQPDDILDKVDINALLDRIDVNDLLDRVDPDALLDRVDVNRLLDRVDVNTLMDRVDIDALMDRVDVEGIVERAGIADIVRESTGALAGSAIDVFRRQLVAIDTIVGRATYRVLGRDPTARPEAPAELEEAGVGVDEGGRAQITGHYAGPVSRLLAFVIDVFAVWAGYLIIAFALGFVVELFSTLDTKSRNVSIVAALVFMTWAFGYHVVSYSIAGKTVGMAVIGLRVLTRQGDIITGRQSIVRTLVLPISVFFFGLGCIGIITSPERRSMHDAAAGSIVVYDWGDRPAEMPAPITKWISERSGDAPVPPEV